MAEDEKHMESPETIPHWRLLTDQGVVTREILEYDYPGSGTQDDPYAVSWIPNDPRNPMLFSLGKKITITLTVAFSTLIVSLTSSAYSGSIKQIMSHFEASEEVATIGLSLFVLGFAIGPLLWAPLSEVFGRQRPFFVSFVAMAAFSAGCAGAQNIQTLLVLRFLAGSFGSSPFANGGGTISDMFPAKQRALALGLYAGAPFMGPCLGPFIGGFLGMNAGWRWVEGFLAICAGLVLILITLLLPETYAPILLRKRAERLSQMTGKVYRSKVEIDKGKRSLPKLLQSSMSTPWVLLFREPIVFLFAVYIAIVYGTLYMMFAAFPIVYEKYRGWNQGVGGLAFIGVMTGMILATFYTITDNKRYARVHEEHDGFAPPEARLPPCMLASILIPIGLFWFAWTNSPSIHWIVSIIAVAPFGFGVVIIYLGVMNYLIDSYTIYAASVLAANSLLRSLAGAAFPLFTTYMYDRLGIHWASCIPAFLSLAYVPAPFLFYKYGAAVRTRCKYAGQSAAYMRKIQENAEQANARKQVEMEEARPKEQGG
ncbi:hypothetical protein ASPWEDRAFT_42575 [Aspergillus wentii DTO 134E9]|uniref:Major facilitator superfamily (MFS) profile domain-containing protein n=1 Tax=Aspergillus wentii DTO 134E9 TaxID=1073089 RepID=A0A1L9RI38_ASPWE|nr:uncharacterized protein ASPWEDRAFT_42575 [Aspergillus wentii DTO 134E9]KAI9925913.1 hypothetical protein MW887_005719 [Aspergillus wentii]OJJ34596.1 hypothetical protein ASPWEDRAFT_42575 [Aspergillus wentii DTO 134E9]